MFRRLNDMEREIGDAVFDIHQTIFPLQEEDNYDDDTCVMCGEEEEEGEDYRFLAGRMLCRECYNTIPRFTRMMATESYTRPNWFAYDDYECEPRQIADQENAVAMHQYAPSDTIGWSQPEWDAPLTEEWIDGFKTHLQYIRTCIIKFINRLRMTDEEREYCQGNHPHYLIAIP